MAPRNPELIAQVRVGEIARGKQRVRLYSNLLGAACYKLNREQVEECIEDLRASRLLEAGLVFASEVRSCDDDSYMLSAIERRHFVNEIGCPPLLLACHACGVELEHLREQEGSTKERISSEKERELQMLAAQIVEILLESGARISTADVGPIGNTALHVAAKYGASHLLSALLRMDADVSARNNDGKSPESIASSNGRILCAQILQVKAMIEMDKHAADLVADEEKAQRKQDNKEAKRQKKRAKQSQQLEREAKGVDGDEQSENSEVPPKAEDDDSPPTAYGRDSVWSKLDEDVQSIDEDNYPTDCVEDVDLVDERYLEAWGEYDDWGEDWYEGADNEEEESEVSDDDDELKVGQLEQQFHHLDQGDERLKDRECRLKAGDPNAKAWQEERATAHARAVWRLEKQLTQREKQQQSINRQLSHSSDSSVSTRQHADRKSLRSSNYGAEEHSELHAEQRAELAHSSKADVPRTTAAYRESRTVPQRTWKHHPEQSRKHGPSMIYQ